MSGRSEEVKETPQQRAMVELAMNQLADYEERWLPLQRNLAEDIVAMGEDDSRERRAARGLATTENEAQFGAARRKLEAGLGQSGNLGTSKGKMAIAGAGEDQATSRGLGMTQAEQQIDDAYTAGLASIMAVGQGQKGTAMQGLTRSAAMSGRQAADDAQASLSNRMGNAQLVGQFAGMGLGLYGGTPDASGMTTNSTGTSLRAAEAAAGVQPAGVW